MPEPIILDPRCATVDAQTAPVINSRPWRKLHQKECEQCREYAGREARRKHGEYLADADAHSD